MFSMKTVTSLVVCSSLEHFRESAKDTLSSVARKSIRRKNIVGPRVAEARRSRKPSLTQDALSGRLARLGIQVDRAAVAKIENNHRHVLDYELKALAKVLDVTVDWLLGDEKK
jgi:hypothetical protein